MKMMLWVLILSFGFQVARAEDSETGSLNSHLESLRPLLGKTWKGAFKNSTPEKPVVDVMRWERALNGQAVRVLHSINDGAYGGETIFRWDEVKNSVTYHYFTTAGFMTTGTLSNADGKTVTHEVVSGTSQGISEVKSTSSILPNGNYHITTEYLKNGEWEPGRDVIYEPDAAAKVVFK